MTLTLPQAVKRGLFECAFETCSPKQREAYQLRASGLHYWQIAEKMGVKEGACRALVFRARETMKAFLESLNSQEGRKA